MDLHLFGRKSKTEDETVQKEISDLIEDQRKKEKAEIYRRAWCIDQATCVLADCGPEEVTKMAKEIHAYVYGGMDTDDNS